MDGARRPWCLRLGRRGCSARPCQEHDRQHEPATIQLHVRSPCEFAAAGWRTPTAARSSLANANANAPRLPSLTPVESRETAEEQPTAAIESVEVSSPAVGAEMPQLSGGLSPTAMLALQRTAGNQAAGRALAASPRSIQRDGVLDAIGD